MTTYYLQSQLTEKLGTDVNLAEQIELTPQTADSFNGGGYLRAVANWNASSDINDTIFVPPANRTYKYLSVHNTGTTPFNLTTVETIQTISSFIVDSVATDSIPNSVLSTQLNGTKVNVNSSHTAALSRIIYYNASQNSGGILVKLNGGRGFRLFYIDANDFSAVVENAAGATISAQTYSTAEFYSINTRRVGAGETVVAKADATHTFSALSTFGYIPFFLLAELNNAGNQFQAAQATITGIEA
jgi:hypothetical protein